MKKYKNYILITLMIAAAFFRLWRIDQIPISLYIDELDLGYHAYSILKTGKDYSGNLLPLHFQSHADWRTPFNIYSTVPSVALFGITSLGIRLPVALFGIISVWGFYLLVKELTKNQELALLACGLYAFSPWHIQFSRMALEVSQLLAFLIFGLYFFFKSVSGKNNLSSKDNGNQLWIATVLLTMTPLIYSTAKLFTPVLILFLLVMWRKEIFMLPRKHLRNTTISLLVIGFIVFYATLFSGGRYRFSYISVFTNPTISTDVGFDRLRDARMRGEVGVGVTPNFRDKLFHNKVLYWYDNISKNILQSFSTEFLFINGDPNSRHSIPGAAQFLRIDFIMLFSGVVLFLFKFKDKRIKRFIVFWTIFGVVPAALTRDGGNHSIRLILVLPSLLLFVAFGILYGFNEIKNVRLKNLLVIVYVIIWIYLFARFQHQYYVHSSWDTERMWSVEYKGTVEIAKKYENEYEKIVISNALDRPNIFFAAYYPYDPEKWQQGTTKAYVEGFGNIEQIDKFYFGQVESNTGIEKLGEKIDKSVLYLAAQREVNANLVMEPEKTPDRLKLVDVIQYPSGEPAFYAFTLK